MKSIKKLEMAPVISEHEHVRVEKSFFGLVTKYVYTPTGSPIHGESYDLSNETGHFLLDVLELPAGERATRLRPVGKIEQATLGNMRLEYCESADGHFLALQLFHFSNFFYQPLMEAQVFEGEEAKELAAIL